MRREKQRSLAAAVLILFVGIPVTVLFWVLFLSERWYLIASLLVLLETMIPFFLLYEGRKPRAREVAMAAMLSALTVIGDLISFQALPVQFGTAMVILSGISFGPETGFLVGALSRLIVNFFQGQGSWTPWQMFAWGALGFIAGISFHPVLPAKMSAERKWAEENRIHASSFQIVLGPVLMVFAAELFGYILFLLFPGKDSTFFGWRVYAFGALGLITGVLVQRKRLPADPVTLTVFTFFTVLIMYGGIMNLSTVETTSSMIGASGAPETGGEFWERVRTYYITGLPYDLWHAFRAALVMFLFGSPVLRRLERVKVKYGFYR